MLTRSVLTLLSSAFCVLLVSPYAQAQAGDYGGYQGGGMKSIVYGRQFPRRQFVPGRVGNTVRSSTRIDMRPGISSRHRRESDHQWYNRLPYCFYDARYPNYYPRFSPYYDRDRRSYDDYFHAYRKAEQYDELKEYVRRREARLRRQHLQLMNDGLAAFYRGDYRQAANQFAAAAESNQGDPASRLHAAHALMGVGDYPSAVVLLRRAFQLQPKIIALAYDIRDDYGNVEDFESQLARLHEEAIRAERDADLWVLLGYMRFYSGDRAGAYTACRTALKLSPRDPLAARLAKASMTAGLAADR